MGNPLSEMDSRGSVTSPTSSRITTGQGRGTVSTSTEKCRGGK